MQFFKIGLYIFAFLCSTQAAADEKVLDFWVEGERLISSAKSGSHVDSDVEQRRHVNYRAKEVTWSHSDKKVGDMSFIYSPTNPDSRPVFGFSSSLWGLTWDLREMQTLKFWTKTQGVYDEKVNVSTSWPFRLVDTNGKLASGVLEQVTSDWRLIKIDLSQLDYQSGFLLESVKLFEFEKRLPKNSKVFFDDVHFAGDDKRIGITDKTLEQRMAEAKETKQSRIRSAFISFASDFENSKFRGDEKCGGCYTLTAAFANMFLGSDLESANLSLLNALNAENRRDTWSLWKTPMYIRFYFLFSDKGKYPNRLDKKVQKRLLEVLWERTAHRNDFYWAKQDTWWMDGSENHDLNEESCNIATSRIFMQEKEYSFRILPNLGYGGGALYGKAGYYAPDINHLERQGGGRANLSNGTPYKPEEHYHVWLEVFDHYVRERAKHGFFLENNSPGYAKHTLGFLDLGYIYSDNENLTDLFYDFYNLYWANWAQVSQFGTLGGPKTRHRANVGDKNSDKGTNDLVTFHLGGPGNAGIFWYWNLLNDFELHPVVWNMVLDREGMGEYAYLAKAVGEEQQIWPRPKGAERTLMIEPNSRMLKSTWVTPDYTLGAQMDHPAAIHSHLSIQNRWQGLTVASDGDIRIVPVGLSNKENHNVRKRDYDVVAYFHAVHHQNTMIVQRAKQFTAISPVWFPTKTDTRDIPIGIYVGKGWEKKVEKDGWVFLQSGNVYAAVRPVIWNEKWERENQIPNEGNQINFHRWDDPPTAKICNGCYRWNKEKTIIELDDSDSPVLIEAGRQANFGSFSAFIDDVLDNPLALYKAVVPGFHELVYTGSHSEKEIIYNSATPDIPRIGGEYIQYNYPKTFSSPYIDSDYGSGEINIQFGTDSLFLDFNKK